MFKGIEIKKLVLVSTLCCVLLIVSVSLYLILSSRSSLRDQADKMKTAMAEEIAGHLQGAYSSMADFLKSSKGLEFGSNTMDLIKDTGAAYAFFTTSIVKTYDADFVVLYTGDKLEASATKPGLEVPVEIHPGIAGNNDYLILNELGGREGTFLVLDKPGILPGSELIYAIDNTAQINSIRQAFQDEKSQAIKQQVAGVAILFLLLLLLSLAVIYFSIARWLGRPISRLSEEAQEHHPGRIATGGGGAGGQHFRQPAAPAQQRAGHPGQGRDGDPSTTATPERSFEKREINKVIALWAAITTLLFLASTIIMLVTSIAMTNTKTNEILKKVDQEMADYYSSCYDSIVGYTKTNPDVYVGNELWNPNAPIDREATIERLVNLVRVTFNSDAAVAYVNPPSGSKYFTAVREGVELKETAPHQHRGPRHHLSRLLPAGRPGDGVHEPVRLPGVRRQPVRLLRDRRHQAGQRAGRPLPDRQQQPAHRPVAAQSALPAALPGTFAPGHGLGHQEVHNQAHPGAGRDFRQADGGRVG